MSLFTFIKENVSIIDVIQEFVALKKAGLYWKGRCPFHQEKTASFSVSPHKEIFYCFGCHEGGDAITFISKMEHCSQLEAARWLTDKYHLVVPESLTQWAKTSEAQTDEKNRYWQLCKTVAEWCNLNLTKNPAVKAYLASRKVSQETIQHFGIGYFPKGQFAIKSLIEYLNKKNILLDDALQAHIIVEGKHDLYSPFEDRIIFPITDHAGNVCAFGGRIFKKDDERAKYYNSREHQFFTKGAILFGLDKAKNSIRTKDAVFLVEGYMDCIAMVQHGYTNTVATQGTACTAEHIATLSRYSSTLYVLYDGDNAGQAAILRLAHLCWQANIELKNIPLPLKEDPASYLATHGSIDALLKKAQDIFDFYITTIAKDFATKNLHHKMEALRTLLDMVQSINDQLKQDILLKRAAQVFDLPFESLKRELQNKVHTLKEPRTSSESNTHKDDKQTQKPVHTQTLNEITELEKKLFSVIINNASGLPEEDEAYLMDYLTPPLPLILTKLTCAKKEHSSGYFNYFFESLTHEEKQLVSQLSVSFQDYDDAQNLEYLVAQFQKRHWKTLVNDVKDKLLQATHQENTQEVAFILDNFQKLKKKLLNKGLI